MGNTHLNTQFMTETLGSFQIPTKHVFNRLSLINTTAVESIECVLQNIKWIFKEENTKFVSY